MFLIDAPIELSFVSFLTQLGSHFVIASDLAGVKVVHFYQNNRFHQRHWPQNNISG